MQITRKKASAFARDFCRSLGPTSEQGRISAYVGNIAIFGVWLSLLVPVCLSAPTVGGPILVYFLSALWIGVRQNRECWALARRRRSLPLEIRKRLYRDGTAFILLPYGNMGYWKVMDTPELRELRAAIRKDQLVAGLLIPPLILFVILLSAAASFVTGGIAR